jgi:hypothetical protein
LKEPGNWAAKEPEKASAWIDSILVFESAAELGERDEMVIYGITAKPSELAGAALQAFAGFLDQKFRLHDYEVGRQKAQEFLKHSVLGTEGNLPRIDYQSQPTNIDHSLDGLKVVGALRDSVVDVLKERAMDLVNTSDVGLLKRFAMRVAVDEISRKLR